jgi:hypothetical protein
MNGARQKRSGFAFRIRLRGESRLGLGTDLVHTMQVSSANLRGRESTRGRQLAFRRLDSKIELRRYSDR